MQQALKPPHPRLAPGRGDGSRPASPQTLGARASLPGTGPPLAADMRNRARPCTACPWLATRPAGLATALQVGSPQGLALHHICEIRVRLDRLAYLCWAFCSLQAVPRGSCCQASSSRVRSASMQRQSPAPSWGTRLRGLSPGSRLCHHRSGRGLRLRSRAWLPQPCIRLFATMVAVVTWLWGADGQARSSTAAEAGGLAGLGVPVQLGRLLRGEDPPLLGHLDLARFHSCRCARSAAHAAAGCALCVVAGVPTGGRQL